MTTLIIHNYYSLVAQVIQQRNTFGVLYLFCTMYNSNIIYFTKNFKSIVCSSRETEDIIKYNLENITSNIPNFDKNIFKIVYYKKLKQIDDV